jgi:ElaB/YqjD/DUF883 family membrane-anchored ribosome-binding protein
MSPEERSPEQIRADIDRTREQLGDTVEALAEKTDVKAQAQAAAQKVQARAKQDPKPLAIGAAVVLILFLLWMRRRS